MASSRLFVDTWGWVVLSDRDDPAHAVVSGIREAASGRRGAWITTDYVLDETFTRLFSVQTYANARRFSEGVFEAAAEGLVHIEHVTPDRFDEAWRLRLRYRDKPRISFTDFTSFVVMRELRIQNVLTADTHFEQVGLGFVLQP